MNDDHIVRMNDDQFKKVVDAAYELDHPDNSLLPDPANSADLGGDAKQWNISATPVYEDEGPDLFFSLFRTMLEQNYVMGKITKEYLIEALRKLYSDDGLDIAEAVEEIELSKEKFIRSIIDQAKKEIREEMNGGR